MGQSRSKFFVLAMPRSRTYWLSKFLTTDSCKVEHDGCCNYSSVEDMQKRMPDGNCDTALALLWRQLEGKVVLIDRDYDECLLELKKMGFDDSTTLRKIKWSLDEAKKVHPVIKFEDLGKEEVCKWLFEYLTEEPFDKERWSNMDKIIMQVSVKDEMERFKSNEENLRLMFGGFI